MFIHFLKAKFWVQQTLTILWRPNFDSNICFYIICNTWYFPLLKFKNLIVLSVNKGHFNILEVYLVLMLKYITIIFVDNKSNTIISFRFSSESLGSEFFNVSVYRNF